MPLHRLNEKPTREAILADLTCDSDGKIDQFIDLRDVKSTLPLHKPNGSPYYLGAFLVGAYQEILGDLHNLFGDTNTVHVSLAKDGSYRLEHVVKGVHSLEFAIASNARCCFYSIASMLFFEG
jgi:arginine decarboxylase